MQISAKNSFLHCIAKSGRTHAEKYFVRWDFYLLDRKVAAAYRISTAPQPVCLFRVTYSGRCVFFRFMYELQLCVCVFARFSALPFVCCNQWIEISNILFAPFSRIIRTVWCATENKYCALKLHKIYNYNFHAHEHSDRSPFNSNRFDLYVQPPARICHLLLGWLFSTRSCASLQFKLNQTNTA